MVYWLCHCHFGQRDGDGFILREGILAALHHHRHDDRCETPGFDQDRLCVIRDAHDQFALAGFRRAFQESSRQPGLGVLTAGAAIQNVATMRAQNGAEQSRLGFAAELLTVNKANLEAASSRIMDVDVAEESTQLARWNILVQSGTAMLSQANQSAQTALKLLQG